MSSAVSGTCSPSSRKYLVSRSSLTSPGSKLTERNAFSVERVSSGNRSLACDEPSTSRPHSSIFWFSNSCRLATMVAYTLVTSFASSRSRIERSSCCSLSIGICTRSTSPRHHVSEPEIGGRFEAIGGVSR